MQTNKEEPPADRWLPRTAAYLRGHRRAVHDHVLRGVSYGVGSGAVSLIIMWWQSRH
jgi:hypothetical protein